MVRAPVLHTGGQRFKSSTAHHFLKLIEPFALVTRDNLTRVNFLVKALKNREPNGFDKPSGGFYFERN